MKKMKTTELIEHINDGFVAFDREMNYTYVNKRGGEMLGRKPEELIGKNYWTEYPEAKGTPFANAYMKALETQETIVIEDHYEPWDRWFENRIYPSKDGLSILFTEITERKRMERELRLKSEELERYFENSLDLLCIADTDGYFRKLNSEWTRSLGYDISELIDQPFMDFIHPEDVQATQVALGKLSSQESILNFRNRYRHKDGTYRWIEWHSFSSDKIIYAAARDVTERKHAEDELKRAKEKLENAERIANLGSWELDAVSGQGWWSPNTFRLLGLDASKGMPSLDDYLDTIHPDDRELVKQEFLTMMQGGEPSPKEFRTNPERGPLRYLQPSARRESDSDGNPFRYLGVVLDVTEQKLAEIRKNEAIEKLEKQESLLRLVLQQLPVGVWIADAAGNIMVGNEAGQKIWAGARYVDVEQYGEYKGWWSDSGKRIEADEWALARAVQKGETSFEEEIDIECFDGTRKTILNSALPIRDANDEITGAVVVNQDVTERMKTEKRIKASEELLRRLIDGLGPYMFVGLMKPDGTLLEANQPALAAAGLEPQDVLFKPLEETYWWTYSDSVKEQLRVAIDKAAAGIPSRYDVDVRVGENEFITIDFSLQPLFDGNGNVEFLIPSAVVITERKRAEEKIRQGFREMTALNTLTRQIQNEIALDNVLDATFSNILEVVNTDMILLFMKKDQDLELLRAGPSDSHFSHDSTPVHSVGQCLCGLAAFTGEPVYSINLHDDPRCTWEECKRAGIRSFAALPLLSENRVIGVLGLASGAEMDYEKQASFLDALSGEIALGLRNALLFEEVKDYTTNLEQEIIERKRTEQALISSEQRYRNIVENLNQAHYEADRQSRFTYCNPGLLLISGYTEEELLGRSSFRLVAEEDRKRVSETYREWLKQKQSLIEMEFRVTTKSGRTFWVEQSTHFEFDQTGRFVKATNILRDIDERKRAEEALRKSEERFRRLAENAKDMIYRMSLPDGVYEYVSPAATEIFGYTPEEFYHTPVLIQEAIHPDWREYFTEQWKSLLLGEMPPTYEYQIINKSGNVRWLNQRNILIPNDEGKPVAIEGIVTDITDRKESEEALRKSEETFSVIFRKAPYAVALVNVSERVIEEVNEEQERLFGYSREKVIGKTPEMLEMEFETEQRNRIRALMYEQGFVANEELTVQLSSGARVDVLLSVNPVHIGGKDYMLTTAKDITERKRMEGEVIKARELFEKIFHYSPVAAALELLSGRIITDINSAFEELFGFTREELIGKSITGFGLWENDGERDKAFQSLMENGSLRGFDWTFKTKSGSVGNGLLFADVIEQSGEKYLLIKIIDMTKRNLAEAALRESEERMRLFIGHAPAALAMFDREMRYLAVSKRWSADYQLTDGSIIGRSHYDVFTEITEEWKAIHRRGLRGEVITAEEDMFIRADGSIQWLRWEVRPWYAADGSIGGIVIFSEDITDRKHAEEEIMHSKDQLRALSNHLQSAIEDERAHIAREIHDDLGQALTALKIDVSLCEKLALSEPSEATTSELEQGFATIKDLLTYTTKRLRNLITSLRPELLQELGVVAAIEWYISEIEKKSGLACTLNANISSAVDMDRGITVYRILQESLNNVIKHAEAHHVAIDLKEENAALTLTITDDGKGIQKSDMNKPQSFGLLSMKERAQQFGGVMEITRLEQGTQVRSRIPLEDAARVQ